jgi:GMP synthase-like glutamine amidotransferase
MSDLLIVKNVTREGPGLLADVLAEHSVSFDIVDLAQGQQFPSLVGYKALVILGGPASANDATETMTNELARAKQSLDSGIPFLGICLGMQVLVKAAGGQVVHGAAVEAGFMNAEARPFEITLTDAGKADPLLAGLHSPLPVFQLHGEVAELIPEIKLLGTAPTSPNQIVKVGVKAYGIQSHLELTDDLLQVWAAEDPDLKPIGHEKLRQDFEAIKSDYTKTGEALLHNFLKIAGLIA